MTFSNSEIFINMTEYQSDESVDSDSEYFDKKTLRSKDTFTLKRVYRFIVELEERIKRANKHQRKIDRQRKDEIQNKIESDENNLGIWERRCQSGFHQCKPSLEFSNVYIYWFELDINLTQSLNVVQNIRFNRFINLSNLNFNGYQIIDNAYVHFKGYKKYHKQLRWKITHPKVKYADELIEQAFHPKRIAYKLSLADFDEVFNNI